MLMIIFYFIVFGRYNNVVAAVGGGCSPPLPFYDIPCTDSCFTQVHPDFHCNVGNKLEWENFRNRSDISNAKVVDDYSSVRFKPPLLTKIALHPLPYADVIYSPALYISFSLNVTGELEETKAILLTFQSPVFTNEVDKKYTDESYSVQTDNGGTIRDGRRYRLFDFSTSSMNNSFKQISFDYKCLYGLDDCSYPRKVYQITLTSLTIAKRTSELSITYLKCRPNTCFTSSLDYIITAYPIRYKYWNTFPHTAPDKSTEIWKMTIATTNYPTPEDVYIIFEPPDSHFSYYMIIIKKENWTQKKTSTAKKCIFKSVPPGLYKVQIDGCQSPNLCTSYIEDHEIVVVGRPRSMEHEVKERTGRTERTSIDLVMIIFASAAAFGLSLCVICTLLYCRNQRKEHKPLPQDDIEMTSYNECAGEKLKIRIIKVDDETSVLVANEIIRSFLECGLDISFTRETLNLEEPMSATYFLIVLPCFNSIEKLDSVERNLVASYSLTENMNILVVYFPYKDDSKIVKMKILQNFRHIYLMRDFFELLQFVNLRLGKNNDWDRIKSQLSDVVDEAELRLKGDLSHSVLDCGYQTNRNGGDIERNHFPGGRGSEISLIFSAHTDTILYSRINEQGQNSILSASDSILSIDSNCPTHGNRQTKCHHYPYHFNYEVDATISKHIENNLGFNIIELETNSKINTDSPTHENPCLTRFQHPPIRGHKEEENRSSEHCNSLHATIIESEISSILSIDSNCPTHGNRCSIQDQDTSSNGNQKDDPMFLENIESTLLDTISLSESNSILFNINFDNNCLTNGI